MVELSERAKILESSESGKIMDQARQLLTKVLKMQGRGNVTRLFSFIYDQSLSLSSCLFLIPILLG